MADETSISPLSHREPIAAGQGDAALREREIGKLILRCDADSAKSTARKRIKIEIPDEPNTSSYRDKNRMLWFGPDEWMVLCEPKDRDKLHRELADGLSGVHHQLVNVSDQYAVIELSGARAREILMKLTTLDLHPKAFGEGDVAGSHFGRVNARLCMTHDATSGDAQTFMLIVSRSFADYLWCLLAHAGREYGLPEQKPRSGEPMRS